MSFFLVFVAVVLIGAVLWVSVGARAGKKRGAAVPALLESGFAEPPANLPPVLLPANAAPADVDRVRFSIGLRGYRMDQVDQVLDELRDQLAACRHEAEALKAELRDRERNQPAGQPENTPAAGAPGAAQPGAGRDRP